MKPGDFFDAQHGDDTLPLPLAFRLLRRFETSRNDVAATLLEGGESLLDIGCGDGELVASVRDRYRRIVAADVSPAAIASARERHGDTAEFMVLDASRQLPFEASAFQTVVSLSTLQYIFDPDAFLADVHRVLAPGGRLLVEVPNMAYLPQRLRLLAGRPVQTSYWPHGIDGGNLHYFTVDSLRAVLVRNGFEIETVTGSGIFAPLRTVRVSLLCGNIFMRANAVAG